MLSTAGVCKEPQERSSGSSEIVEGRAGVRSTASIHDTDTTDEIVGSLVAGTGDTVPALLRR